MEQSYPDQFRLVQRIVIELSGDQFDCLGALAVRRGDAFRAQALSEMGGKLFDFLKRGAERRVLIQPDGMPENPLLLGVIGDLEHLFDPELPAAAVAGWSVDGRPRLVFQADHRVQEYVLDAEGARIESSLEAVEGQVVRRASYADYRRFAGFERELPARIQLENLEWRYRLEIELLELRSAEDLEGAFEVDP